MSRYEIKERETGRIIHAFDGAAKECVMNAIKEGIRLTNADLRNLELKGVNFSKVDLTDVDFSESNLEHAIFKEAHLTGTIFTKSTLDSANFKDAGLKEVVFTKASLNYTNFRDATISDCGFIESDLNNADFRDVTIIDSEFTNVNMNFADFRDAECVDGSFEYVRLSNAKIERTRFQWRDYFTGSKFKDANLRDADYHSIKYEFFGKMAMQYNEIEGLRKELVKGRIDGRSYSGRCACFAGTVAKLAGTNEYSLNFPARGNSLIEKWFYPIRPGDTPSNSPIVALTVEWIDEFLDQMKHQFGK